MQGRKGKEEEGRQSVLDEITGLEDLQLHRSQLAALQLEIIRNHNYLPLDVPSRRLHPTALLIVTSTRALLLPLLRLRLDLLPQARQIRHVRGQVPLPLLGQRRFLELSHLSEASEHQEVRGWEGLSEMLLGLFELYNK